MNSKKSEFFIPRSTLIIITLKVNFQIPILIVNLDNSFYALLKLLKDFIQMPHPSGNGGSRVRRFSKKTAWHTGIRVLREYQKNDEFFLLEIFYKQKKLQSGFLR